MRTKLAILSCLCALLVANVGGKSLIAQTAPTVPSQGPQLQDSINELSVGIGKTVLVDTAKPIARVTVGVGDVIVASAVNPTEIMVNGKTAGETSLIVWDVQGNRQFFNVSVHSSNTQVMDSLEGVRRELRTELPQQTIRLTMENGTIFLHGTVADLASSDRAVKIASTAGKVVNLLNVRVPDSDPQILLKVRFAAVDRTLEKDMGANLFNLGLGNSVGGISTGQFSAPSISGSSGSSSTGSLSSSGAQATFSDELNLLAFFPGLNAGADLKLLESKGLVQVLAEPNVLATNGKEASFLAGGQFPYPVVQGTSSGSAAVTIQFKDYGIRLNFIPTITPRGTIRLQVAPEVSALDYSHEVTISGFTVPGITSRRVNTEVELADGQSFGIGGLLDNTITETFDKIPFLSSIPILGKFFESIQRTKNNSELIVFVTPEIVAPMAAGQPLPTPKFPEAFLPPNSNIPMNTPDTQKVASKPAPTEIPVEKLIESMKPEPPLIIETGSGGFGAAGTVINSGSTSQPSSSGTTGNSP